MQLSELYILPLSLSTLETANPFSPFYYMYYISFWILSCRLSGGSIVGPIAPHQAFAIGGPSSVRGYGEGAVGSGQSCLVSKSELAVPLV